MAIEKLPDWADELPVRIEDWPEFQRQHGIKNVRLEWLPFERGMTVVHWEPADE